MDAQKLARGYHENLACSYSLVLKRDCMACRAASASGRAENRWTTMASARPGEAGEAGAPKAAARLAGAHHEHSIR